MPRHGGAQGEYSTTVRFMREAQQCEAEVDLTYTPHMLCNPHPYALTLVVSAVRRARRLWNMP